MSRKQLPGSLLRDSPPPATSHNCHHHQYDQSSHQTRAAAAAAAAAMALFKRMLDQIPEKSVSFSSLFLLFQRNQALSISNMGDQLNLIPFIISLISSPTFISEESIPRNGRYMSWAITIDCPKYEHIKEPLHYTYQESEFWKIKTFPMI